MAAPRTPLRTPPASSSPSLRRRSFLGAGAWGALGLAGTGLGLSGCGSSGSSASPDDFTFTFWGSGAEKTAVTKVVDAGAKAAGLNGRAQSIPTNYDTKINTLLAANTPPDAGYLTESMAMRLGEQGKLVNVVDRPVFADYLPTAIHWYSADGAVAQSCNEALTLFYDTEAATAAGVTVPTVRADAWDWDAFVQAADALTADSSGRTPSQSGFKADDVQRYGLAAPTAAPQLFSLLKSNGIDMFTEDGTKSNLASPEAVEVFQKLNDLVTVHRVSPTPAQATNFGASSSLLLASKRVCMVIDGTWGLLDFAQSDVAYDTAALPVLKDYVTLTLSGATSIFAATKHQDFALQLLDDLSDPAKVDLYSIGLWMPAVADYYTDEAKITSWTSGGAHPAGFRTAVIDNVIDTGVSFPSYRIKDFATIATTIGNAMGPIVTTPGDVTAAVQQLAATVDGQLKGAYPDTKPA